MHIGGFFELELPLGGRHYHQGGLRLSTGRASVALLIRTLNPASAYLPYYCCEALVRPFAEASIPIRFYRIGEDLTVQGLEDVKKGEWLVCVNYFGMMRGEIEKWVERLGDSVVVDNTQAFFARPNARAHCFNSARKFFGVPDGSYLHSPAEIVPPDRANEQIEWDHLVLRLCGRQAEAFARYRTYEAGLTTQITSMSRLSEKLLATVDYEGVAARRRTNFDLYACAFGSRNRLKVERGDSVPFCYPLLAPQPVSRSRLAQFGVYVPTFWPEVLDQASVETSWERHLAESLLPLPVDHRYGRSEIHHAIQAVEESMTS